MTAYIGIAPRLLFGHAKTKGVRENLLTHQKILSRSALLGWQVRDCVPISVFADLRHTQMHI